MREKGEEKEETREEGNHTLEERRKLRRFSL